jgi:hypothetical protein
LSPDDLGSFFYSPRIAVAWKQFLQGKEIRGEISSRAVANVVARRSIWRRDIPRRNSEIAFMLFQSSRRSEEFAREDSAHFVSRGRVAWDVVEWQCVRFANSARAQFLSAHHFKIRLVQTHTRAK